MPNYLNLAQAANRLSLILQRPISKQLIRYYIRQGQLTNYGAHSPYMKVLIDRGELENFRPRPVGRPPKVRNSPA